MIREYRFKTIVSTIFALGLFNKAFRTAQNNTRIESEPICQEGNHHLAIIIPFKGRFPNLVTFLPHMERFLKKQEISHTFILVSQVDIYRFNRASLINIGAIYARGFADYMVMHDVDLLPLSDHLSYCFPKLGPMHLATWAPGLNPGTKYEGYIGGIVVITLEDFMRVNGMSNLYWGWGKEDDDFGARLREEGLQVQRPHSYKCKMTFKDIHRSTRDDGSCKNQRRENREKETGVHDVDYTIRSLKNFIIASTPIVVMNVELKCDTNRTPWCICSNASSEVQ